MSEFKQGAKPLAAATIGNICGALTITTYTQSFFVGPVTAEFGWSAGQFFLGFTIAAVLSLISAPLVGSLALKYGIRPLAMIGLVGHAIGYFLLSLNPDSLPVWYATWAAITFLTAGALPVIWTAVLNSWFVKGRGKAIGITMAGSGVAAFILPPLVQFLINGYGWRAAYQITAAGALVISLPLVFLWFKEKSDVISSKASPLAIVKDWGMTRNEAMRTIKFWNLALVLFLTVFTVVGLLSNFKPIFQGEGVDQDTIALLAAIMGATIILGRLLVGALVDKYWAPAVACVFFSILTIALILFVTIPYSTTMGVVVAISIGLAAGAELDLLAYLTSKYFGPRNYSAIFGCIFAIFALGGGVAAPIFGEMASRSGSYTSAIYLGIIFLIVCLPLYLTLGPYSAEAIAEAESH